MSALSKKLTLNVVTPERELVHEDVDEVQLRAKNGYLGILPGHAPLLTELGLGEMRYRHEGHTKYLAIVDGFAEVLPDRVIVLAEVGECAEDIDVDRAKEAVERAKKRLSQPSAPGIDWDRASVALARALMRLQVAQHGGAMADHE